jgi:hypothetical protein
MPAETPPMQLRGHDLGPYPGGDRAAAKALGAALIQRFHAGYFSHANKALCAY